MITALALMSLHKSPTIPLDEICERYLALSRPEAMRKAARNELPFPVFRLSDSRKAPWVVTCEDLGSYIDQASAEARAQWQRSQV